MTNPGIQVPMLAPPIMQSQGGGTLDLGTLLTILRLATKKQEQAGGQPVTPVAAAPTAGTPVPTGAASTPLAQGPVTAVSPQVTSGIGTQPNGLDPLFREVLRMFTGAGQSGINVPSLQAPVIGGNQAGMINPASMAAMAMGGK